MFEFVRNTLILFFGFIFIAIPLSIIAILLLLQYMIFCEYIAGCVGVFLGIILLMAIGFASLIRY